MTDCAESIQPTIVKQKISHWLELLRILTDSDLESN